jgi:hypothetical protein
VWDEPFRVRDRLIEDYRDLTGSFVDIHDKSIGDHVRERMARGYQWPDPWLSLNPNFASAGTISDLVAAGLLHPECERIFRLKNQNPDSPVLRLHKHQREAIEAARTGASYVLTTGTGSGKSLAYIIPVVDRVLAAKTAGTYRPGIKAIAVYPMNALANSQLGELQKFLTIGYRGRTAGARPGSRPGSMPLPCGTSARRDRAAGNLRRAPIRRRAAERLPTRHATAVRGFHHALARSRGLPYTVGCIYHRMHGQLV